MDRLRTSAEATESVRGLTAALEAIAADRQKAELRAIQAMPLMAALQSNEKQTQTYAQNTANHFVSTLKEVARKKASVEETMALLLRETRAARVRKRRRILVGTLIVIGVIAFLVSTNFRYINFWWLFQLGGGVWAADQMAHTRQDAAQALRKAGDPRAVGVLAVAMRDGDARVQRVAEEGLRHLLPRVRASDAAYIASDQMDALLRLGFQSDTGVSMKEALLQALEQIGDERAIPLVQRLLIDENPSVRERAEECLPFVEERVRRARESHTLLRASSATSAFAKPDELLRPASASMTTGTPAEQLLRPTIQEQREEGP